MRECVTANRLEYLKASRHKSRRPAVTLVPRRYSLQLTFFAHLANCIQLTLQGHLVEHFQAQAGEDLQSRIEFPKCLVERAQLSSSVPSTAAGS
jgi:hypothetical protein